MKNEILPKCIPGGWGLVYDRPMEKKTLALADRLLVGRRLVSQNAAFPWGGGLVYDRPMGKKRVENTGKGMLAEQHRPSEELDRNGEILVECHPIKRSNPPARRGGLPQYLATQITALGG